MQGAGCRVQGAAVAYNDFPVDAEQCFACCCGSYPAFMVHPTPYTPHPTPSTLHLHPTHHTLNPEPHPLPPTPYTLHPQPYTLHQGEGDTNAELAVCRDVKYEPHLSHPTP